MLLTKSPLCLILFHLFHFIVCLNGHAWNTKHVYNPSVVTAGFSFKPVHMTSTSWCGQCYIVAKWVQLKSAISVCSVVTSLFVWSCAVLYLFGVNCEHFLTTCGFEDLVEDESYMYCLVLTKNVKQSIATRKLQRKKKKKIERNDIPLNS